MMTTGWMPGARTWRVAGVMAGAMFVIGACAPAAPPAAQPTAAVSKPAATTAPPAAATAPAGQVGTKPAAKAPADWEAKWNELVTGARREGEVTVYGPTGGNYREVLVDAFQAAYPGIKVNYTGGGPDLPPRIIAERQAGKFIPDVQVNGTTTLLTILKPAGALDPVLPLLVRPDVTDTSKWYGNQLWWADDDQQYDLMFEGGVSQTIAVNTNLVKPETITSYWDLLDPKYKGKVVASDIRKPGPGGGQSRFVWSAAGLGEPFLRKLFGEMEITLVDDRRQLADWLAQGRYSVAFFPGTNEINEAAQQGLPVGYVDNRKLKEGFPVSAAFGTVVALNQRPHPNAATVYINWLVSPEGQIAWQKAIGANSMRMDIPKDTVGSDATLPASAQKDTIFFASIEKYQSIELSNIQRVITEAYGK